MKTQSKIILGLIVVTLIGLAGFYAYPQQTSVREQQLEAELSKIKAQEEADQSLGQYALNMMGHTFNGNKLSSTKKQVLARAIVRIANDVFDNVDHKKAFVAVLAIESGFSRTAQSPTGPKGYAQLAKAAFKEGIDKCGSASVGDDDVFETDINLAAGACYFRFLLEKHGGDPYIAIVAYNQGPASDSIKTYSKTGDLDNKEALKYVAKFTYLKRKVTDQKMPGAPVMEVNPIGKK